MPARAERDSSGWFSCVVPFLGWVQSATQLDDDAAEPEPAVEVREPQLARPDESAGGAGLAQVLAVVGAAVPEPATDGTHERVLGDHEEELAARLEHAGQLQKAGPRVGQVLE